MQYFCWLKDHMGGFTSAEAAVSDIERAVSLRYVVRVAVSEKPSDAIDGRGAAFEFEECADRSLIELNFQVTEGWERVRGPEFLIMERWPQTQRMQDSVHFFHAGNGDFELFPDLVTGLLSRSADCRSGAVGGLRRALIGEDGPGRQRPIISAPFWTGLLDANANELAATGQILSGGVIERVRFMGARGDLSGAELFQPATECEDVCYAEFDFDFLIGFESWHDGKFCAPYISCKIKKLQLKSEI